LIFNVADAAADEYKKFMHQNFAGRGGLNAAGDCLKLLMAFSIVRIFS
jgi:hypothetical protein